MDLQAWAKVIGGLGVVLLALLIINPSHAQKVESADGESIDSYFDDGGWSSAKGQIKVSLLGLAFNEIGLGYEQRLGKSVSLQLSGGYLVAGQSYFDQLIDDPDSKNHGHGYYIGLSPRLFIRPTALEGGFISTEVKHASRKLKDEGTLSSTSMTFNIGQQLFFQGRWSVDYSMGVGTKINKESDLGGMEDQFDLDGFIYVFRVNLGYLLPF